jgi:hypothetical protein
MNLGLLEEKIMKYLLQRLVAGQSLMYLLVIMLRKDLQLVV